MNAVTIRSLENSGVETETSHWTAILLESKLRLSSSAVFSTKDPDETCNNCARYPFAHNFMSISDNINNYDNYVLFTVHRFIFYSNREFANFINNKIET